MSWTITDDQLARLSNGEWRPEAACVMQAPCALVRWDGHSVTCEPTGEPMAPAAAMLAPVLAASLQEAATMAGMGAGGSVPPEPAIAALVADYEAAAGPFDLPAGCVVPAGVFAARLDACRACRLWRETAREGRGRCDSVRCHCTGRRLFLASEACPEGLWTVSRGA